MSFASVRHVKQAPYVNLTQKGSNQPVDFKLFTVRWPREPLSHCGNEKLCEIILIWYSTSKLHLIQLYFASLYVYAYVLYLGLFKCTKCAAYYWLRGLLLKADAAADGWMKSAPLKGTLLSTLGTQDSYSFALHAHVLSRYRYPNHLAPINYEPHSLTSGLLSLLTVSIAPSKRTIPSI